MRWRNFLPSMARQRWRGDLRHTHRSLRFLAHVHWSSTDDAAVAGRDEEGV
jgi:hypothetical protein